ncbi:hypothetical protein V502_06566 [Pseudogymnoascus sp. VKM F-4520 (FW-2644)]|nr:hypothetical protein V502_06566 [Pseudogymnoascus sp. VKM F-4520 (FW-2644)]
MQLCGADASTTVDAVTAKEFQKGGIGRTGGGMTRLGHDIEMYCMQLCGMPVIHSNNSRRRDEAERWNRSEGWGSFYTMDNPAIKSMPDS